MTPLKMRVVMDTNVLWSGIRSGTGASREIFSLVDLRAITLTITVPLVLEYESVLKRDHFLSEVGLSRQEVDAILDYLISRAHQQPANFLWRPFLPDPKDDCVLEAAVNGLAEVILTFNSRDFSLVEKQFGIRILTPREFLRMRGDE